MLPNLQVTMFTSFWSIKVRASLRFALTLLYHNLTSLLTYKLGSLASNIHAWNIGSCLCLWVTGEGEQRRYVIVVLVSVLVMEVTLLCDLLSLGHQCSVTVTCSVTSSVTSSLSVPFSYLKLRSYTSSFYWYELAEPVKACEWLIRACEYAISAKKWPINTN